MYLQASSSSTSEIVDAVDAAESMVVASELTSAVTASARLGHDRSHGASLVMLVTSFLEVSVTMGVGAVGAGSATG